MSNSTWRVTFKVPSEVHDDLKFVAGIASKERGKSLTVDQLCRSIVFEYVTSLRAESQRAREAAERHQEEAAKEQQGGIQNAQGNETSDEGEREIPTETSGASASEGEDL